jgi:hypothetical protein
MAQWSEPASVRAHLGPTGAATVAAALQAVARGQDTRAPDGWSLPEANQRRSARAEAVSSLGPTTERTT